jgi:hypothetical protein
MKSMTKLLTVLVLASIALLAGCSKKPPGCADPKVSEVIRQIAENETKTAISRQEIGRSILEDVGGITTKFFASIKVDLANVVQDSYSEDARKFMCRGKMTITSLGESTLSKDVVFSSQATADDSGHFLVEVEQFPFTAPLMRDLAGYVFLQRTNGTWVGDYACDGLEGSDNPLAGPYTMPVSMVVQRGKAKLERTTSAGGLETLTGTADLQSMNLRGEGRNTPDDTWQTVFWGDVKGSIWNAQGEIRTTDGRLLRHCTLTLQMPVDQ